MKTRSIIGTGGHYVSSASMAAKTILNGAYLVMESRNMHKYNSSIHGTVDVRLPPVIFLWLDHTTFSSSLPGSENESMLDRFRPVSMCCTFPTNQSHFECR